jgi:hypothetical protein
MARYGKAASESVRAAMRRKKRGTLRSGKGGKGGIVKSRKQAIAIGLPEARKRVPRSRARNRNNLVAAGRAHVVSKGETGAGQSQVEIVAQALAA